MYQILITHSHVSLQKRHRLMAKAKLLNLLLSLLSLQIIWPIIQLVFDTATPLLVFDFLAVLNKVHRVKLRLNANTLHASVTMTQTIAKHLSCSVYLRTHRVEGRPCPTGSSAPVAILAYMHAHPQLVAITGRQNHLGDFLAWRHNLLLISDHHVQRIVRLLPLSLSFSFHLISLDLLGQLIYHSF